MASAADVAVGLSKYLSKGEQLREWGTFLLGAANVVSFERLEHEDDGDAVLGALWDVAFGRVLRPEQIAVVRRLAETP
jgi:hypothetical protein